MKKRQAMKTLKKERSIVYSESSQRFKRAAKRLNLDRILKAVEKEFSKECWSKISIEKNVLIGPDMIDFSGIHEKWMSNFQNPELMETT